MTYLVLGRILDSTHRAWTGLGEHADFVAAMKHSERVDARREVEAQVVAASALTAAELRHYRTQIAARRSQVAA